MVQALSEAGLSFEAAANIIGTTPVIAGTPNEVVDVRDLAWGVRSLSMCDPRGGWLPSDIVPGHIWERHVLWCHNVQNLHPGPGDRIPVPPEQFVPNERGTMVVDRGGKLGEIEIKPLTGKPEYYGEIDPLGLLLTENTRGESLIRYDEHLLIVNGKWVFEKTPNPQPLESLQRMLSGNFNKGQPLDFAVDPLSVIEADKKTVRVIGWGRDEEEQDRARYHLSHFESLLDVNVTLAIRRMKRRAYGLPVGS